MNTSTTLKVGRDGMNQLVAQQRGRLNAAQTRTHDRGNEIISITGGRWIGLRALRDLRGPSVCSQPRGAQPWLRRVGCLALSACIRVHLRFPDRARGAAEPRSDAEEPGATLGRDRTGQIPRRPRRARRKRGAEHFSAPPTACTGTDGRNHRIVTKTYASGLLDEVRHAYYTEDWQLLEERLATPAANPQSLIPAAQFVWGVRYTDDLVLRDRDADESSSTGSLGQAGSGLEERLYAMQDANWNVVAIADTSGAVQERYVYSAYGTPKFLTAAFVPRSPNASGFAWETLFAGGWLCLATLLYSYRRRSYVSSLGRFGGRDPIGYAGGENPYQYTSGGPINRTDPLGTCDKCEEVTGSGSADNSPRYPEGATASEPRREPGSEQPPLPWADRPLKPGEPTPKWIRDERARKRHPPEKPQTKANPFGKMRALTASEQRQAWERSQNARAVTGQMAPEELRQWTQRSMSLVESALDNFWNPGYYYSPGIGGMSALDIGLSVGSPGIGPPIGVMGAATPRIDPAPPSSGYQAAPPLR